MSSAAAPRSNTLSVPPNTAIEVVMKYQRGREVQTQFGVRYLFTLIDGEQLWCDVEDAQKIHALGLGVNEPMRIYKRVVRGEKPYMVFSRVADQQRQPEILSTVPPAAAIAANRPIGDRVCSNSQPQNTPELPKLTQISHDMASCHIAAIDALLVSAEYARSKGLQLPVTPESVHTTANTLYIQLCRRQERM